MKTFVSMLIAGVAAMLLACAAAAQEPAKKVSPFALPQAQGQAPAAQTTAQTANRAPGFVTHAWTWLMTQQSSMNRQMAAAVKDLKGGDPVRAAGLLMLIAFLYGVLHAAGPGHGKAVISSYVLTNEETVRRGIALSFLSALFQALSAILFVGIFALLFNKTSLEMRASEALLESLSWALVAIVGAVMLYRQVRATWPRAAAGAHMASHAHEHEPAHEHAHHHDHADGDPCHAGCTHAHHSSAHSHAPALNPGHVHGPDCGCGHSHMPSPKDLQGAWSWRKALPLALSVGIRPCTGALLLLIFALSQGMWWAGVLGTLAMAFGTALTVSVLAALAVSSRDLAERLSGEGSRWAGRVHTAAGFAGAGLVFLMGCAFFFASLQGGGPL